MDSIDDCVQNFFTVKALSAPFYKPEGKVVVFFGSAVNGAETPKDIDVLSYRATEADIRTIINRDPNLQKFSNLPLDVHQLHWDDWDDNKVKVPIPWDSTKTNFLVAVNEPKIQVTIDRCKSTISSLFRDETKTDTDIARILTDASHWSWKGIPVHIEEFDGANHGHNTDLNNTYINGRISLKNSVDKHLGKDRFNKICNNIWWGDLLNKIYEKPPTEAGLREIRTYSPRAAFPTEASFWVLPEKKMMACTHGFYADMHEYIRKLWQE